MTETGEERPMPAWLAASPAAREWICNNDLLRPLIGCGSKPYASV